MSERQLFAQPLKWHEIFPWLIITRAMKLALRPSLLLVTTAALLILPLGWRLSELLFVTADARADMSFANSISTNQMWIGSRYDGLRPSFTWPLEGRDLWQAFSAFGSHQLALADPFVNLFQPEVSSSRFAYYAFGGIWSLLIWAVAGGVITRIAGLDLACDRKVSLREAVRHVTKNFGSYLGAPIYPQAGAFAICLPLLGLGLLMRSDVGVLIGALLWPLAILGGLVIGVLIAGLVVAWPLMWPVVSLEEQGDAFEALSRSYSFALQRPLRYVFYLAFASLIGGIGVLIVHTFAEWVLSAANWGVSWGTGVNRFHALTPMASITSDAVTFRSGVALIETWTSLVRTVASAFGYSFFFCAVTAIYLVLRRDVDETEFDEVYISESESRVPPDLLDGLKTDSSNGRGNGKPAEASKDPGVTPASEKVPSDDA